MAGPHLEMRTLLFLILGLGACNLAGGADGITAGTNLVRNPGMEVLEPGTKIPSGWKPHFRAALETVGMVVSAGRGHAGKRCLELAWKSGGAWVGVEAGLVSRVAGKKQMELSAFARIAANGEAVLVAECLDRDNKVVIQRESGALTAKAGWTRLRLRFTTPGRTARIRIYLLNRGRGTVWFDDVVLAESANSQARVESEFPLRAWCMPAQGNALWNNGKVVFNTFVDSPCSLSFHFWGDSKKARKAAFVVELPQEVKLAECFDTHNGMAMVEVPQVRQIKGKAGGFTRYVFVSPRVFGSIRPTPAFCRELTLALIPARDDLAGREFTLRWWLEYQERCSAPGKVVVRFLPPLARTPNPKHFPFYCWASHDLNFHDIGLLDMVVRKYEQANMHARKRSWGKPVTRAIDRFLQARGWRMFKTFGDCLHARYFGFALAADAPRVVKSDGEREPGKICPTFFRTNAAFRKAFRNHVKQELTAAGCRDQEIICLDYEPWQPRSWCFCERCRKAFAGRFKLKATPAAREILSRFRLEWRCFKLEETTEIIRIQAEAIRAVNPTFRVADYDYAVKFSQPGFESYFDSVAKDTRMYEKYIDLHVSSFYHYNNKQALDLIDVNVKTLRKDVWMIPSISRKGPIQGAYTTSSETIDPVNFRIKMLGAVASGCKGMMIFPGPYIDGRYFQEIDRGMAQIAVFEDFYMQGERVDSQVRAQPLPLRENVFKNGGKEVRIASPAWNKYMGLRAHRIKSRYLATLFNFHQELPLFCRLFFPAPSADSAANVVGVYDPTVRRVMLTSDGRRTWTVKDLEKGVLVRVGPHETGFLVLGKLPAGSSNWQERREQDVRAELNTAKAELAQKRDAVLAKPVQGDGLVIRQDDLDRDGIAEILIKTSSQSIWISPANGGKLLEWQVGASATRLCKWDASNPKAQAMFWDLFWQPKDARWSGRESQAYTVVDAEIERGVAVLTLRQQNKELSLEVQKTFRFSARGLGLEVEYTIRNVGDKTTGFSFWSRHCPRLGDPDRLLQEMRILLPCRERVATIVGSGENNRVYVAGGLRPLGFSEKAVKGTLLFPRLACYSGVDKTALIVRLQPGRLQQFYFWRGRTPTVEWMYRPTTLAPGKIWQTRIVLAVKQGVPAGLVEDLLRKDTGPCHQ